MILAAKTKGINLLLALLMVAIFTTLQSSSCSKSDDVAVINPPVSGTWQVSLYWDKKDETSKFSSYNFSFNAGGQVTSTNGASTITGTWSESSTKFTISFGADPVFSKLNKDWLKEERTATTIKLKDDNPTKDEKVQFIKI